MSTATTSSSIKSSWLSESQKCRILDLAEKCVLTVFFGYFLVPIAQAVVERGDAAAILVAISEGLVVGLILFRKPANSLSLRWTDWMLAFGATIAPLFVRPDALTNVGLQGLTALLMVIGILGQIYSKYTLGRRFGVVAANRGICDRGPYRLVRHPIYFFYFVTHLGILLAYFSLWNLMAYVVVYSLLIPRILAEERLLSQDPEYANYMQTIRSRLIPGVF